MSGSCSSRTFGGGSTGTTSRACDPWAGGLKHAALALRMDENRVVMRTPIPTPPPMGRRHSADRRHNDSLRRHYKARVGAALQTRPR